MLTGEVRNKVDKIWNRHMGRTGLDELYQHDIKDLDMQGNLYEYMLGKMATAGQNGQFRTPKHIRDMMVRPVGPNP